MKKLRRLLCLLMILTAFPFCGCITVTYNGNQGPNSGNSNANNGNPIFSILPSSQPESNPVSDPKELYRQACEKMDELEDQDILMQMEFPMEISSVKMDVVMTVLMQVVTSTAIPEAAMVMDMRMGVLGGARVATYVHDGSLFVDDGLSKTRLELDPGMLAEMTQRPEEMNIYREEMAEMLFADYSLERTADGLVIFFNNVDLSDAIMNIFEQENVGDVFGDSPLTIRDITGSVTINKAGYITETELSMDMVMTLMDQSVSMPMSLMIRYNHPGEPVVIDFPDFSAYNTIEANP